MSQVLLELKGIKKYFPVKRVILRKAVGFVKAVDNIDLKINAGESLGLVGESGCGKTTLARIILRLINPDCGRIIFREREITKLPSAGRQSFRKDIQIVFQDPFSSLDPRFKIVDIISESAALLKERDKFKIIERVKEVIACVGLNENMLERFPHEFSGGERQRIAIARAFFLNPKLLVLDEAVSSLDILIQNQILNLLLKLKKDFNLTYIFISHNLKAVKKISQRVAVMYQGRIVEMADTGEIFNLPMHPYTKVLLSAAINFKVDRHEKNLETSINGCGYAFRCSCKKDNCLKDPPSLREISPGHFIACHF